MAAGAKNRNRMLSKDFAYLNWSDSAYFCDEKANSLKAKQMYDPNYNPWVTIKAMKLKGKIAGLDVIYYFLYSPNTGKLFFKTKANETFKKIKSNRKIYQKVVKKIKKANIKIYSRKRGYIRRVINKKYYGKVTVGNV